MKVIVGFVTEKFPNPSEERVVGRSVRLAGGLLLPNPLAESAKKICVAPAPEISISKAPKFQFLVVPLNGTEKVYVSPTPCEPATVTIPAPFVQ